MLSLFSAAGQRRLDTLVNPRMLCVFDFDGTLSPIVPQPDEARLPLAVKARLEELAALAKVAIITGRSLSDLRPRLAFAPHYLVGNHGLEGMPGWEARSAAYAEMCRAWEAALLKAMRTQHTPGIWVENKRYTLSVHYRLARDHAAVEEKLQGIFEKLQPTPRVIAGKCVFSLVPPDAMDKGQALAQLMAMTQAENAIYVGDDVTDEDVFALARQDLMSVRIGYASDSQAQFFLAHTGEMVLLLEELIRRLRLLPA
jgi:trehalose 6-phosphate phosphatase